MPTTKHRKQKGTTVTLPVLSKPSKPRMGIRRAIALLIVHLLIIGHIFYYHMTGSSISPLEPSEAAYSIREGIINAGAIFFAVTIIATLIFGRFFCGWACHVVAYQDMARWLMMKIGLQPKPIRMRLAFLIPLFAAYWLYGRPMIEHLKLGTKPSASWHLVTEEFWRTFPGPIETCVTIAVCGFLIVYFLGSKGFCTYGCPYGALYGVADKVAFGRIRVKESCDGSSVCTAHCSSNVDVAREVRLYGKVVDPNCLKCMDCVTVCPNEALYFGFRSTVKRPSKKELRQYDFSWLEEFVLLAMFALCFWISFRLYRTIPMLLAVGMSSIVAYLLMLLGQLAYASRVQLQRRFLRNESRLTLAGRGYLVFMFALLALLSHSAVMQWNIRRGEKYFEQAYAARERGEMEASTLAMNSATRHLSICDQWGLMHTRGLGRMMGQIQYWQGHPAVAVEYFQRDIDARTHNPFVLILKASALAELGRSEEAQRSYRQALDPKAPPTRYIQTARALIQQENIVAAHEILQAGMERHPAHGDLGLELCKLLVTSPDPGIRNLGEALRIAEQVCDANDYSHADLLAMLAWLYHEQGSYTQALITAQKSLDQARAQGIAQMVEDMSQAIEVYRQSAESTSP